MSDATCIGVLYAAKKYMVISLKTKCKEYLKQHMRLETVWNVLEHALKMDEEDLSENALAYIDERTEECLQYPQFKQVSHETLCRVLERDSLNVEEVNIFRACLESAGARCLEEGVPVNVDEIRADLGRALYLVRFPVMDISDFSNEVVNEGVLSDKEVIAIFLALTREQPPPNLQFSEVERSGQLLNMASVFTTGMAKIPVTTGGPFATLAGADIYPVEKDVMLKCIYFANISKETFKKVKQVTIQCTDTDITYSSDAIRSTAVQGPHNGYYNAKAIFKDGVGLKSGHWNNITFQFDPPLAQQEAINFEGTPIMTGNDIQFEFEDGNFFQFTGIAFKK